MSFHGCNPSTMAMFVDRWLHFLRENTWNQLFKFWIMLCYFENVCHFFFNLHFYLTNLLIHLMFFRIIRNLLILKVLISVPVRYYAIILPKFHYFVKKFVYCFSLLQQNTLAVHSVGYSLLTYTTSLNMRFCYDSLLGRLSFVRK